MDAVVSRPAEEVVKSLVKVVSILNVFSTSRRSMSLAEISAATGFPHSTTHRLAASMREVGLLDQDRHRDRYRLGIKLFELGNVVLANMDLHREARPIVDALSRISGHLVHLAVFDGRQAVVIHRADPAPETGTPLTLIEVAPVHCTSVGKAILAFQAPDIVDAVVAAGLKRFTDTTITGERKLKTELKAIRKRGYAVDDGEHQPGLRCVGAPIRDQAGRVIAGLSVSGPARRLRNDHVAELAKIVIHHADLVSAKL
jgi:DNA-binding IclR family transcriptional regulator